MSTGLVVETFAEAQAVAICWIGSGRGVWRPASWDGLHNSEDCGWCAYPQPVKLAAVEAFNRRPDAEAQRARYFALGPIARRRLVREAQGYPVAP